MVNRSPVAYACNQGAVKQNFGSHPSEPFYGWQTEFVAFSGESTEYRKTVEVIPVEIEVPSEIDAFVKREILDEFGRTYPKWIQECYLLRIREILKNPAEFGKLVLEEKKRDHCIQDYDLED
jgi:hypothetical protein